MTVAKAVQTESHFTMKTVFAFFLPIAIGIFVVSFIYPIFSWGISRFSASKEALAAFSVARSLYFIMASPILVLRQTVVALVTDHVSYTTLRTFTLSVIAAVFSAFLLIGMTPIGQFVFGRVMGTEDPLLSMSRQVFVFFAFVVVLSGYSLFLQGLAILGKRTKHILIAMIIQIGSVAIILSIAPKLPFGDGATAATISYACGVLISNLYLDLAVRRQVVASLPERNLAAVVSDQQVANRTKAIFKFYLPLVLATFILCLSIPMINAALAKTAAANINLSAFDVAWGLGWLILGTIEVSHQIPLYFLKQKDRSDKKIFTFIVLFGLFCTMLTSLIGFTPLGMLIIERIMGIEQDVSYYVILSMKALTALPMIMVLRQYLWGLFMYHKYTNPVTWGKAINIICLFTVLAMMPRFPSISPVVYVLLAMAAAEICELVYLLLQYLSRRKNGFMSLTANVST